MSEEEIQALMDYLTFSESPTREDVVFFMYAKEDNDESD